MLRRSHAGSVAPRRGYVLIAVLVVVVVLSLVAYRFTDSMTGEYKAAARTTDVVQARAAAVSGIHYAAAMLADPETFYNVLYGDPTQESGEFQDIVVWTDPKTGREARFSVVSVATIGPGEYQQRFAVEDEGGKLNINALIAQDPTGAVLYNALLKLPHLQGADGTEIAAAIVDWVDEDDEPGQSSNGAASGAENSYYLGLTNPYQCKNRQLNTLGELLLVKGVTPQLLFGTDQNQSGGTDDRGLSEFLTVHSREISVDAGWNLKIYLNGDELQPIYEAMLDAGIDEEIATYIVAVKLLGSQRLDVNGNPVQNRGGKGGEPPETKAASYDELVNLVETKLANTTSGGRAVNSISDLFNTRVVLSTGGGGKGKKQIQTVYNSPLDDPARAAELLPILMDKLAPKEAVEMVPRLNVNTATREVIAGLPGLDETDVDNILAARESQTPGTLPYVTASWLWTDAGLTRAKYRDIEKFVTGTSMMYRIQAIGYMSSGGPVARVEAVIDTNLGYPRIVSFRDLTDLDTPRLYQPVTQKQQK